MSNRIQQPRNAAIHSGATTVGSLDWSAGFAAKWNGNYYEAQKYVDSEVLRLSDPYTPMQTGMLIKLGMLGTIPGSGEVIWNGPYARYLYYGKLMVGRAPKTLTNTDLQFHGAPKRGAFWFERMKADHLAQILAGARLKAGGGT